MGGLVGGGGRPPWKGVSGRRGDGWCVARPGSDGPRRRAAALYAPPVGRRATQTASAVALGVARGWWRWGSHRTGRARGRRRKHPHLRTPTGAAPVGEPHPRAHATGSARAVTGNEARLPAGALHGHAPRRGCQPRPLPPPAPTDPSRTVPWRCRRCQGSSRRHHPLWGTRMPPHRWVGGHPRRRAVPPRRSAHLRVDRRRVSADCTPAAGAPRGGCGWGVPPSSRDPPTVETGRLSKTDLKSVRCGPVAS